MQRRSLPTTLGLSLVTLCAIAPLTAQALDPTIPAGGFDITDNADLEIRYADGGRTLVDIRYPSTAPGPNGWPVMLIVHGLGGDRKIDAAFGNVWASRGFLSAIYDVRGQGVFPSLSPKNIGAELIGKSERLDMVEIVAFIRQRFGEGEAPLADLDRLGITGLSQGGAHAWAAAAWSGKDLPDNERGITQFPVFKAACPNLFPPYSSEVSFPQGASVQISTLSALFLDDNVSWHPDFANTLRSAILDGDFATAAKAIDDDPFRRDLEMLKTSDVPVFAQLGWNDTWASAAGVLEALDQLPDTTTHRVFLEPTIGHGLEMNLRQVTQHISHWDQWMSHYLKNENNGIDRGAEFITGVVTAEDEDTSSVNPGEMVWNRHHDSWPPDRTDNQRFFLRQGSALSIAKPDRREPADLISQEVDDGYDMRSFVEESRLSVRATLEEIPLSSVLYDSPTLEQDMEIAGTPLVHLQITPDSANYQVNCALYQVSPTGTERFICSGICPIRGEDADILTDDTESLVLDIAMIPTNAIIPAGHKIRLRIANLSIRSFRQQENLWVAPYFNDFSYRIEHTSLRTSWFDLPVRQTVQPALSTSVINFNILRPEDITYSIEAPRSLAGHAYLVYFSASGTDNQQQMVGSDPLRLVTDQLTHAFLSSQSPLLTGMNGTLSENGTAEACFLLKHLHLPSSARGLRLSTAVVIEGHFGPIATNPVDLYIR